MPFRLTDVVRQHAGTEALRIASREDDLYAVRLNMGQSRDKIEEDAEAFFRLALDTVGPFWRFVVALAASLV